MDENDTLKWLAIRFIVGSIAFPVILVCYWFVLFGFLFAVLVSSPLLFVFFVIEGISDRRKYEQNLETFQDAKDGFLNLFLRPFKGWYDFVIRGESDTWLDP